MKILLLSGGSGKRLWPLSNEARSKQFMKVLKGPDGTAESMIQRVVRQAGTVLPGAEIMVISSAEQADSLRRQLPETVKRVFEPARKGTYPAILYGCAELMPGAEYVPAGESVTAGKSVPAGESVPGAEYVPGAEPVTEGEFSDDEVIVVMPVDPYVEETYFETVKSMEAALEASGADICLMGIKPTYPSEKYGYFHVVHDGEAGRDRQSGEDKAADFGKASSTRGVLRVTDFVEKPGLKQAGELVASGALWNAGVFAFRGSYAKRLLLEEVGSTRTEDVSAAFSSFDKISFDHKIISGSDNLAAVIHDGEWSDLGTWNTLTAKMPSPDGGNVVRGENCVNTHVINELEIPIVALGLKDTVVVASADGILVSDKHKSSYMESYVEQINNRPMYEKRQWGEYTVLDVVSGRNGENSLSKRLYIEPGRGLSCQKHRYRDEIWTVIDGEGLFLHEGELREVKRGDTLFIKRGETHAMGTRGGITFFEVQLGSDLIEEDIERFEWDWSEYLQED